MGFLFGQDFTYTFYPLGDSESIKTLPSQTPAIYVFTDSSKPSRSQAAAGTGALQSIAAWTANSTGDGFDIAISAISDPSPTSTQDKRVYWIAINFLLKTAGQTQTVVKALEMERVGGHQKRISITYLDVQKHFPNLLDYFKTEQVTAIINISKDEIKAALRERGFEWAKIFRPDYLNLLAIFKTLMHLMLTQRVTDGDNWDKNYLEFKAIYDTTLNSIQLDYDTDGDGQTDAKVDIGGTAFIIR